MQQKTNKDIAALILRIHDPHIRAHEYAAAMKELVKWAENVSKEIPACAGMSGDEFEIIEKPLNIQ